MYVFYAFLCEVKGGWSPSSSESECVRESRTLFVPKSWEFTSFGPMTCASLRQDTWPCSSGILFRATCGVVCELLSARTFWGTWTLDCRDVFSSTGRPVTSVAGAPELICRKKDLEWHRRNIRLESFV